jgi:SGNH domain (fused to AT3 domains)
VEPSGRVDARCGEFNTTFLKVLADDPSVRTVVLAGRWARFFFAPGDPEGRTLAPLGGEIQPRGSAAELTASLGIAVDRLTRAGKRVVLIGQAPAATEEMPRCLAAREWRGLDQGLCALRPETLPDQAAAKAVAGFAAAKGVPYINPTNVLCTQGHCAEYLDGQVPVLGDTDHLTQPAALAVLRRGGFDGALRR